MKKNIFFLVCFLLSISLNIFFYFKTEVKCKLSPVLPKVLATSVEKKSSRRVSAPSKKMVVQKVVNTLSGRDTTNEREDKEYKEEYEPDEVENSYESLEKKRQTQIENYLSENLELDLSESMQIFDILDEAESKIDKFISYKSKLFIEKYGEDHGYMYDPEDYLYLGQTRIKSRESIKKLIGSRKYYDFIEFVNNYNSGKFNESYIPFEF